MSYGILPPEYISGESYPMRLPSSDAVMATIGQYDSPEAAQYGMDQRQIDMLTESYRKRTGDAFADPFKDVAQKRDTFMMDQALNGASIASGGRMGPRLLSNPVPTTALARARTAPAFQPDLNSPVPPMLQSNDVSPQVARSPEVATLQPAIQNNPLAAMLPQPSVWAQRDIANEQLRGMMTKANALYHLNDSDMQLTNSLGPNGMVDFGKMRDLVLKRANALGQHDMLTRLYQKDPNVLNMASFQPDSIFTRDAAGKVIPSNDYHKILDNPNFIQEYQRDPQGAAALYRAFSDRDLKTDIDAHSQLIANQAKNRQQVLEGLDSVEADPISGDRYKTVKGKDASGVSSDWQLQKVPLTAFENDLIDKGEWRKRFGRDLPNEGGVRRPAGMTDKGLEEYKTALRDYMAKNPKASIAQASSIVLSDIKYKKDQIENPSQDTRPGLVKTGDVLGQSLIELINRGFIGRANKAEGILNPMLRGGPLNTAVRLPLHAMGINLPKTFQVGQLPVPTDAERIKEYQDTPNIKDVGTQGVDFWSKLLAPYFDY